MSTAQQQAEERAARKLAVHGLKPDGTPADDKASNHRGPALERLEDDPPQGDDPPANDDTPNPLQAEVDRLQNQLNALQGRVAPAQQASEQYRTLYTTAASENAELARKLKEAQDQLDARNKATAIEEVLTEEERNEIDPGVLKIITKVADALAKRAAPNIDVRAEATRVLDEREANKVKNYRAELMADPTRGIADLGQLAYDQNFIKWSQEEDNDVDSVVTSLLHATTTEAVDRYAKIVAKRIKAFRERAKPQPTDPKVSLSQHMRRGDKPKMTAAESQAKLAEAKQLSRSRNPADRQKAQTILNELSG